MGKREQQELISVIVPIYNIKKYLQKCLESILGQTYKNLEIILVDDGSADGCYEICESYQQRDARIKVLHKPNEGLVRARKDGLRMAAGNYISYVDGDDWIEPTMLERLYTTMISEETDIVMCGRYEDMGDTRREVYHGIKEGRYDKAALINEVYPRMIVNEAFFEYGIIGMVWDKLYKREYLEEFQMKVEDKLTMGEDAACVYPCLLKVNSIYVLHECLYHYRQSPSSMIKSSDKRILHREKYQLLYKTVLDAFEKYRDIYDLREQWKEFVLFLMTPRAGYLYQGMEELDYLFPFPNVKKGSSIIIYGMGTYGQFLYQYLKETQFCNVAAAADRNYKALCEQGFEVISPEEMEQYPCDAIVVASSYAKVRAAIYQELISRFPQEKVHIMDEELIKSKETMTAFGLIGKED